MGTHGKQLGIVVRNPDQDIFNPVKARSVQTAAFYQMWRAGHLATRRIHIPRRKEPTLNHALIVHAGFAGQSVQFAQILKDDPSLTMGSVGPFFEFEKVAKSAAALNELLFCTWLPNLQPLLMDDQDWDLFLKIVEILQNDGDPSDHVESLAVKIGLSSEAVQIRASFYFREVVAEWNRWFTGLGNNIPLPRI